MIIVGAVSVAAFLALPWSRAPADAAAGEIGPILAAVRLDNPAP